MSCYFLILLIFFVGCIVCCSRFFCGVLGRCSLLSWCVEKYWLCFCGFRLLRNFLVCLCRCFVIFGCIVYFMVLIRSCSFFGVVYGELFWVRVLIRVVGIWLLFLNGVNFDRILLSFVELIL